MLNFAAFKKQFDLSRTEVTRTVFHDNQDTIRIKKEKTAVKNLEKIFDAVFRISYKKGFQAMTMRDLSRESGMSMGALYGYFASKEDLLALIQRQGSTMIQKLLQDYADAGTDPLRKLRTVIRAHLYLSEVARPWFFFTFMEIRNLSQQEQDGARELEAFTENILVRVLEQGAKEGVFQDRDHHMTASLIKAMQQDWYLKRWKYKARNVSVDRFAETVLDLVEPYVCIQKPESMGDVI